MMGRPNRDERQTWTTDRIQRLRVLDLADGDVEAARRDSAHQRFLGFLVKEGRLSEGERDDERR